VTVLERGLKPATTFGINVRPECSRGLLARAHTPRSYILVVIDKGKLQICFRLSRLLCFVEKNLTPFIKDI